jgi:hypothetical protein
MLLELGVGMLGNAPFAEREHLRNVLDVCCPFAASGARLLARSRFEFRDPVEVISVRPRPATDAIVAMADRAWLPAASWRV